VFCDTSIRRGQTDFQERRQQRPSPLHLHRSSVGKQNHIILWIEEAARPQTREKRVATAVQVAFRAREKAYDREKR
jgi:uncharacterized protein YdeI (YjbR/CyaY-like superfamily)